MLLLLLLLLLILLLLLLFQMPPTKRDLAQTISLLSQTDWDDVLRSVKLKVDELASRGPDPVATAGLIIGALSLVLLLGRLSYVACRRVGVLGAVVVVGC